MKLKRKVGKKGQVVIPKDIREEKNVRPDSVVYFTLKNGKIVIEKREKKLTDLLSEISEKSEGEAESSDNYYKGEIERRLKRADIE